MMWLRQLFHILKKAPPTTSEQCVIVHVVLNNFPLGKESERSAIHRISDILAEAILIHKAGEFDGDVFGDGICELFMYGPDAERLFEVIYPILADWPALKGGYALKRFGPPGSRSETVEFS